MSHNDTPVGRERRNYCAFSHGPFPSASNIHLFYGGGDRGAIVTDIRTSLRHHQPLSRVFGEPGSGKTLLGLVLADRLRHQFNIVRYDHQRIGRALILRHLLIELCPQDANLISSQMASAGADEAALRHAERRLEKALMATPPGDKPLVFMVDSNADTSASTLALLRRLASVRRDDRPSMHVIAFQRIPAAALRNRCQRINCEPSSGTDDERHYWLRRLSLAEIEEYVRHHMILFDFTRRDTFSPEMVYFVADRSQGVFRAINTLARNAFTIASLQDAERLSMSHLLLAGLPVRSDPIFTTGLLRRHRRYVIAMIGSCVVVSIASLTMLL